MAGFSPDVAVYVRCDWSELFMAVEFLDILSPCIQSPSFFSGLSVLARRFFLTISLSSYPGTSPLDLLLLLSSVTVFSARVVVF